MRDKRRGTLAVIAAASLCGSMVMVSPASAKGHHKDPVSRLTKAVTLAGVLRHEVAFQAIAKRHDGTRASGTTGYDVSADYVARLLKKAGYEVTRQPFDFYFFHDRGSSFAQVAPTPTEYVNGTDYDLMEYSGAGDVTAEVVPVDVNLTPPRDSSSGCEVTDFAGGLVTGKVALMQRGSCSFGDKVANAEAAGAVGAIVFNQGNGTPEANPDRYDLLLGTLGAPVGIPAVGVSYPTGEQFATTTGLTVHLTADTTSELRSTENVLAESKWGATDNVVMSGAHLDSVPDGPGINDNGSGSAAQLEVALQAAKQKTKNRLRFAWWGAEEASLVGSTFYVESLAPEQLDAIALYLNFDMVASPNYIFGIYDGDGSDPAGSGPGPDGSAAIEDVFEAFYASRGLPSEGTDFNGRSDYGPFIAFGIPAGGLFTGAEEPKTAEQVAKYGGVEGAWLDPCYHLACDSLTPVRDGADADVYRQLRKEYKLVGNLNAFALDTNADAIATAVITFANDTSAVNGVSARGFAAADAVEAPSQDVHGNALS